MPAVGTIKCPGAPAADSGTIGGVSAQSAQPLPLSVVRSGVLESWCRCIRRAASSAVEPVPDAVLPVPGRSASGSIRASGGTALKGTGEVVFTYPNNSTYEGQIVDGKRQGKGTLTLADGTKYEAEWRKDERHGAGTEVFADGSHFSGGYVDGLRSGHGVMTWPEGSKYSGQFERGRANGEGHLLRTDGSVYKGQFCEDCMSGDGCMQWKDGVEYTGQFVANRREGVGKMKWTNGRWRSYEGDWKDGMQHGQGTLVDHNDQVFNGLFRCGKLVRWNDDAKAQAEAEVPQERPLEVPKYWVNQDVVIGFNERKEVTEGFQEQVQRLLDGTFKSVRTRDRGTGQVPTRLRLLKCHRVENSVMWARYTRAKARIGAMRPEGVQPVNALSGQTEDVRTRALLDDDVAERLDESINEHYLWHGTTPEGAIGVSTNGFRLSLAGSRAGTFFGRGCYFAECSSKSDEYAREGDSILAGVYALLLCRVVCGNLFRTTHADHNAIEQALSSGEYDTVLGDREASVGTYREFVCYDEEAIYPEYVVLYERKFDSPPST